ncbi:MAG: hypothetical protein JWO92_1114 [Chitinophagaceae bacterium]|nr:hypothetical protein [Chitinophagaceae bacterium]
MIMKKILFVLLFSPLFSQALTPVFTCGFECGVLTSSNIGAHWSSNASISFSTTTVRNGARSLRINPVATTASSRFWNFSNANIGVFRFYIRFASLPGNDIEILHLNYSSGFHIGIRFQQSDNKLYTGYNSAIASASGVTVTTGVWYRIDYKYNTSTSPWTQSLSVDGTEVTSSNAQTGEASTRCDLGDFNNTSSSDYFIDDFIYSVTEADYPIGAGYVNHFVPTSDGTHTATTTTIVKGTIATPVGGNVAGSTDVFNWVNGVPLLGGATDNTRLVNQQTAASTLYAEVIFGPAPGISTPTTAPRAVEVITADQEASTATGNFITKLNDNGTEADIVNRGTVAGVTTDRYVRKMFATAPTGGAWTVVSGAGNFNNIRARFGYSSDATPDQYWRGIMIEAEFAEVAASPTRTCRLPTLGVGMNTPNPVKIFPK